MDRIQEINPDRVRWCCEDHGITPIELAEQLTISGARFERMMTGEDGLTFNQLRRIARYFQRGVLFFLESGPVNERRLRTPQFRTIANQRADLSPEIKALIERVERHRDLYLSLLEDLDEEDQTIFRPPNVPRQSPRRAATVAREWLALNGQGDFSSYREAVEARGILVFRSMGYRGQWRIPVDSGITGFSLYQPSCPVIFVKRQTFETRQTFTLMHELGHVLLHRTSSIDDEDSLYSREGRERDANAFAGYLLVPDEILDEINDVRRPTSVTEYGNWLRSYTLRLGVSTEVILRRLLDAQRLERDQYEAYRDWRNEQPPPEQSGGARQYRAREPLHIFGGRYVRTVLDALHARQITLNKASAYLDNLKVKHVHSLEAHLADV